jgi:hypothetical protein
VILIASVNYSRDSNNRGESPYKYVRRNRDRIDITGENLEK